MEGPPEPADPPLASLSLTHVHYNPNDVWSYGCAWLALVPQGLCVVYATLIWSTREVEILSMFVGQMACEALNWGLKRWIKEERPKQMYGKGYGMPSSHAQFVTFFATHLALFLLLRHRPHSTAGHGALSWGTRVALSMLVVAGAGAVAVSRVYLRYHTPKQVLAGAVAGVLFALGWFSATTWLRRLGVVDALLDDPWVRALRLRDLVVDEDLVEAGWLRWQDRVAARRGSTTKDQAEAHLHKSR
ncbi:MAG: hypothetical protein M1815_004733 [Lichina confinis]|nr:MAG: hypothetical protein M1815_004733 [Lichina confinis]